MNSGSITLRIKNEIVKIAYSIRPGNNRTLLFLHGGACSQEDFLQATKYIDLQAYTIVRFDFPGCGVSSYPEKVSLNCNDLVEITRNIIQEFDFIHITFIGHSMGGLVALQYILKYGGIDKFISIEGNLAPQNCVFSRTVANIKTFDEFQNNQWQELKFNLSRSKNKGFQKWSKSFDMASAIAFYDYCKWIVSFCDNPETLQNYITLNIPKLYIYGSENKNNLTFLNKLNETDCNVAEITNSNHFPFYDNSLKFYSTLVKFLSDSK